MRQGRGHWKRRQAEAVRARSALGWSFHPRPVALSREALTHRSNTQGTGAELQYLKTLSSWGFLLGKGPNAPGQRLAQSHGLRSHRSAEEGLILQHPGFARRFCGRALASGTQTWAPELFRYIWRLLLAVPFRQRLKRSILSWGGGEASLGCWCAVV